MTTESVFCIAILVCLFHVCLSVSNDTLVEHHECGTMYTPEDLHFLRNRDASQLNKRVLPIGAKYLVLVKNYIIKNSAGESAITEQAIANEIANNVNPYWSSGPFQYVMDSTDYITSDTLYNYAQTYTTDSNTALQYNANNAFTIYWTKSITINNVQMCGYAYYPYGALKRTSFMVSSCLGSTLAHELGHGFGLPHTHDTVAGKEAVDGSNCVDAGDTVCDTPADPNLSGVVTSDCRYTGTARDPKGQTYNPSTINIMSYSVKNCRTKFTPGQWEKTRTEGENIRETFLNIYYTYTNKGVGYDSSTLSVTITSSQPATEYSVTISSIGKSQKGTSNVVTLSQIQDGDFLVTISACFANYKFAENMSQVCIQQSESISFVGCIPTTSCQSQGKKCGTIYDGCKNEVCGTCTDPYFCGSAGFCTCNTTGTCSSLGRNCDAFFDGCKTVSCGSCISGIACNNGVCACNPDTRCSLQNRVCGNVTSTCGTEICGTCETPKTCTEEGQCVCFPSTSCQQENRMCGELYNGCEAVNCGTCTLPETCSNGICTCIPTTNCAAQGRSCGKIYNGCYEEQCGACEDPYKCNARGFCECSFNTSCFQEGRNCGDLWTGCLNVTCGRCTEPYQCQNGACSCTPTTSCAAQNLTCGTIFNGCDQVNCGTCGGYDVCLNGKCLCKVKTTCTDQARECGSLDTGCGTINCGSCSSGSTCVNGICSRTPISGCEPSTICSNRGVTCGTITDSTCGEVHCGACDGYDTCLNNQCVCTGSITCAEQNRQCNEIFDGCNEIICGQCGDEQYCDKGYCKQLCRPVTNCIIAGAKCGTIFNGCDNTDCGTCANNEECKDGICVKQQTGYDILFFSSVSGTTIVIGTVIGATVAGAAVAAAVVIVIWKRKQVANAGRKFANSVWY